VAPTPIPVALDRFRVDVNLHLVDLGQPIHDVPAEPELVGHINAVAWANLDLPLPAHNLGVGARHCQASFEAMEHHCFGKFAPE